MDEHPAIKEMREICEKNKACKDREKMFEDCDWMCCGFKLSKKEACPICHDKYDD